MNTTNTKTLSALIVDDEKLARRGLRHRLRSIPEVEILGEASSARDAVRQIRKHAPDIVFLDIQMPGRSGFSVIRALGDDPLPAFIFVTAHDDYATRAFEVNAVDYLLKPVDEARLAEAVDRAGKRLSGQRAKKEKKRLLGLLSDISGQPIEKISDLKEGSLGDLKAPKLAKLVIRDGGKTTWVRQEDIEWVEAAGDYMCIHALGKTHIMRKTMKELERELDADFLQRIHRSTIVNVRQVTQMESHINGEYFLTLRSGHTVKLSRSYKDKLKYLQPG